MLTLIIAAALGQCGSRASYGYGYARSYAAPTYYAQQTYAAPVYQQPAQQYYQAPQYSYSLVGDYMRQETYEKERAEQSAKLDVLLKLLTDRAAPPVQAPPPQYPQAFATPQTPAKAPPTPQFEAPLPSKQAPQFEAPYPTGQFPTGQQPPYGEKPLPSSPPAPSPSFEQSAWVPPPPQAGGYGGYGGSGGYGGVAAMTQVFQTRCVNCHVGPAENGGGIKLVEMDGQLADITPYLGEPESEGGIAKAVTSGRMPKKGPRLNNQELYAVLSGLREYAARSRGRANVLASFGQ